jgi:MFS family permease
MPLAQAASMALPVVVVPMRDGLVLTYSELGIVLASFGVARLAMDLPAGSIVQRFNPRRVLLIGLALTLLGALVGCVAVSSWQVGLARVIHGGASSVVQTAILAWLLGRASAASRGSVMAVSEALFSVVSLSMPIAVGLAAVVLSWRAAFAAGVVGAAIAMLVVLGWTNSASAALATSSSSTTERPQTWGSLRVGGPVLVLAFLVTFLLFFSRQGLSTLMPLIGGEQIGLSPFEVGLGSSLWSGVSIFTILGGGWLGDRLGRRRLVVPGTLALLAGLLGTFLISDPISYFASWGCLGVGLVLSFLPVSLIGDALPPSLRPRGIAAYRLVADGALLLAPLMVGAALDLGGFDTARLVFIAVTGAVLLTAWILRSA